MPVDAGDVLYRFRAERIVVATGAIEQPLVFPGNDLVGVMLPSARRRLVDDWALKPGERAVVVDRRRRGREAADDAQARRASRSPASSTCAASAIREIAADGRKGVAARRRARRPQRSPATCSSCPAAASRPTRCSPRRARGSSTTPARGHLRPDRAPGRRRGGRRGRRARASPAAVPAASYNGARARASASSASART